MWLMTKANKAPQKNINLEEASAFNKKLAKEGYD
jgi:hypothetical protein